MAKKNGNGIAAPAPKAKNRVRNGKRGQKQREAKEQSLAGLTAGQNANINAQQNIDSQLYQGAGQLLPGAMESFSQPFQFSGPANPVTGDYNQWTDEQMQNYNNAFDQRMNPQFQRQTEDFEQMAANRGWDPKGELYKEQKKLLLASQNDARTQAYASGQSQATQNAMNLFNTGTQAHQNAYGEQIDSRNRPYNEFLALQGGTSGMNTQNLGFNQAGQLQKAGFANDRYLQAHQKTGGGGGGGAGPLWQQYGFTSPMEYDAYKTQQARDNAMWDFQNNPQYRQQKGPSGGSQILGQALGTGLGLAGMYFGNKWGTP